MHVLPPHPGLLNPELPNPPGESLAALLGGDAQVERKPELLQKMSGSGDTVVRPF